MSAGGRWWSASAGAVLLALTLTGVPATAHAGDASYTGWVHREDAAAAGSDTTYTVGAEDGVYAAAETDGDGNDQLEVYHITGDSDAPTMQASFEPPAGETLTAGQTYPAEALLSAPTDDAGRLLVWRDGSLCGHTYGDLVDSLGKPDAATPATGWFHVTELEYNPDGSVARFAATYELNCQYVGGPPGVEGSVAVDSTQPAASVPDAPTAPGPVTDVQVKNVGPDGSGENVTTLTWNDPQGSRDVTLDMGEGTDPADVPALLGTYGSLLYRGRAGRYHEGDIDFSFTRIYRLVARSADGRLSAPTYVTVDGTRLSIPDPTQTITIGQDATVTGRLSLAILDPENTMNGPGLVGRTVILCQQSSIHYVDGSCTPVDRTKTTAQGYFTLSATPEDNSFYSVQVPATGDMLGNTSRVLTTLVAPQTDLRVADAKLVTVRHGRLIHFTTSRARAGSRGVVRLQRLSGKTWRTIATRHLGHRGPRRLALAWREHARGVHSYRVVKLGDAHHVNGFSRTVRVHVR